MPPGFSGGTDAVCCRGLRPPRASTSAGFYLRVCGASPLQMLANFIQKKNSLTCEAPITQVRFRSSQCARCRVTGSTAERLHGAAQIWTQTSRCSAADIQCLLLGTPKITIDCLQSASLPMVGLVRTPQTCPWDFCRCEGRPQTRGPYGTENGSGRGVAGPGEAENPRATPVFSCTQAGVFYSGTSIQSTLPLSVSNWHRKILSDQGLSIIVTGRSAFVFDEKLLRIPSLLTAPVN